MSSPRLSVFVSRYEKWSSLSASGAEAVAGAVAHDEKCLVQAQAGAFGQHASGLFELDAAGERGLLSARCLCRAELQPLLPVNAGHDGVDARPRGRAPPVAGEFLGRLSSWPSCWSTAPSGSTAGDGTTAGWCCQAVSG